MLEIVKSMPAQKNEEEDSRVKLDNLGSEDCQVIRSGLFGNYRVLSEGIGPYKPAFSIAVGNILVARVAVSDVQSLITKIDNSPEMLELWSFLRTFIWFV